MHRKYPTYPNRSDFYFFYVHACTPTLNMQLAIDTTYQLRTSYTHTYQPLYLIIFAIPHCYPRRTGLRTYTLVFMFTTIQCKETPSYPQSPLIQLNLIYYHARSVVIQTFIFHFCTKHTSLLSSSKK